jgi:hypothetical protein
MVSQDGEPAERRMHLAEQPRGAAGGLRVDADEISAEQQQIGAKPVQTIGGRLDERPGSGGAGVKVRGEGDAQLTAG